MSDLRLEREFPVSQVRLFQVVTTHAELLNWWLPDGFTMPDEHLDFTREGSWHVAMISAEGKVFKVSGQVTKVQASEMVGFTWGWHDEDGVRGAESHVTFTIQQTATGAKLIIDHRELPTDEVAADHTTGWGKMFARIERHLNTTNQLATKENNNG
jgi:uncharacterized protein YndB with AHSA1/START domain